MANRWYKKGAQAVLNKEVDFNTDTIRVALVAAGYTANTNTHDFFDDVSSVVGTPGTLDNPTITDGVFDTDDEVFSSVTGSEVTQLVVYQWTGSAATSILLFLFDTATGLPVTPNGGNITVQWHASGIMALA